MYFASLALSRVNKFFQLQGHISKLFLFSVSKSKGAEALAGKSTKLANNVAAVTTWLKPGPFLRGWL